MRRWRAVLDHLVRTPETDETLRLGIAARSLLAQWGLRTAMAPAEGDALVAEALDRTNRLGDPVLRCLILAVSGSRKFIRGDLGEGVTIMVDNARLADQLREPGLMAGVWSCAWTEELAEGLDRKSTRLNSSHIQKSRMPSSA